MVGIDDLLIAFASAAGKAVGQEVAKELVSIITHNLATKEDIARAVLEIERYVHQEFQEAEKRKIIVDVDTAIRNLKQYQRSRLPTDLAQTQQLLNQTANEIQQAILGDANYSWREFVPIARFVAVASAYWSIRVFDMQEPREIGNLVDTLLEGLHLLQKSLKLIHLMEDETISALNVEHETDWEDPNIPTLLRLPIKYSHYSRASYEIRRGRYEGGGVRRADTGRILGPYNSNKAEQLLRPIYDADRKRIQDEAKDRQEKIYAPLDNAITSLRELIVKLGGNPEETMVRFRAEV